MFQIIKRWILNRAFIGHYYDLTAYEKSVIASEIAGGKSTLEISKMIKRYHQNKKRFVAGHTKVRKRADNAQSTDVSQRRELNVKL